MRTLSADEILALDDTEEREVDVPQWGTTVTVRSISKEDERQIREKAKVVDSEGEVSINHNILEQGLFLKSVVKPTFTEEQYARLIKKNAQPFSVIMKAVFAVTGYSKEENAKSAKSFRAGSGQDVSVSAGEGSGKDS